MTADFEKQKNALKQIAASLTSDETKSLILSFAEKTGIETFREQAADELIRITGPAEVIPDAYAEFRQIVSDGIRFLLSGLSLSRLAELVRDQMLLKDSVTAEERLIVFARRIPSLHKLGQIIARNRNVAPCFRKWLICLENDTQGSDIAIVRDKIAVEISDAVNTFSIKIADKILAEASVGTVIEFTWLNPDTGNSASGVFKILRPGIKEYMAEELNLLDELAVFFDTHRHRYSLKDFTFIETFGDIRDALVRETDLSGEQANLRKAFHFYGNDPQTRIPRELPFSTENLTAMEFMDGCKITDALLPHAEKRILAQNLFRAVVSSPLFSYEERTFFHGDPHAGNIYAYEGENEESVSIALLDWSQAGHLSKIQRINMLRLAKGVIMENESLICEAIAKLSEFHAGDTSGKIRNIVSKAGFKPALHTDSAESSGKIRDIVRNIVSGKEYKNSGLVRKTFLIIDQSTVRGIRFPGDLLLFRKAFFTLEGVIYDIDPTFDMEEYVIWLLGKLFIEELPKRWFCLMFPHTDHADQYKIPLSNADIRKLADYLFIKGLKKGSDILPLLMEKNAEWLRFCLPYYGF